LHALDKSKELNAAILNKNDTLYDLEATLEERQNYLEVIIYYIWIRLLTKHTGRNHWRKRKKSKRRKKTTRRTRL